MTQQLPIPRLSDTLSRLLPTLAPLAASAEELGATAAVARDLLSGPRGAELQSRLEERQRDAAARGFSWLVEWWRDLMYLQPRVPLPVNVSYFYQFIDERRSQWQSQCSRAALLLRSVLLQRDAIVS